MSGILEKIGFKKKRKEVKEKKVEKKEIQAKKGKGVATKVKAQGKSQKAEKADKKMDNVNQRVDKNLEIFHATIFKKMDTEKSNILNSQGKYQFLINRKVNKSEIKKMIERYYKVSVIGVNIINYKSKKKRFGMTLGEKGSYKKAIVTLKEGQILED